MRIDPCFCMMTSNEQLMMTCLELEGNYRELDIAEIEFLTLKWRNTETRKDPGTWSNSATKPASFALLFRLNRFSAGFYSSIVQGFSV